MYKDRNSEKAAQYDKNRYWNKRNKGLCVHHGCCVETQNVYCEEHRLYHLRAHKRYEIKKLRKKLARSNNRSLINDAATTPMCCSLSS